jgi:hypothetical protein
VRQKSEPKNEERTIIPGPKPPKMAGVDIYQWHIISYAALGSIVCFFVNDWIDSHALTYYHTEYLSLFGLPTRVLMALPGILNLLLLFAIFRKIDPKAKASSTTAAPVLAALTVSSTQFVGFLGFSMKTMHLPLVIVHILIAGIIGFSAWTHYNSLYALPRLDAASAEEERKTRITLFGSLLQSTTVLLVSGGIVTILTIASNIDVVGLVPETRGWWPIGIVILLTYLAYGAYCLFLIRWLATTGELMQYAISKKTMSDPSHSGGNDNRERSKHALQESHD